MEIEQQNELCYNSSTIYMNKAEAIEMKSTTITIRVEESTKVEAEDIFEQMGMNFSTAINVFLKAVIKKRMMPFKIEADKLNKKTIRALKRAEEYDNTGKGKKYFTECDSIDDLKKKLGV